MACEVQGEKIKSKLMLAMLLTITIVGVSACTSSVKNPPPLDQGSDLSGGDADGVINERDLCGNSVGADVKNDECIEMLFIMAEDDLHILFENNSAKIKSNFTDEVDQLALFMTDFPETKVLLKGYASPKGPAKYNEILSIKRANAVKDLLVADGIAPERINIKGFGEKDLVMADTKMETATLSRRVTASVSAMEESVLMQWTIYTSAQQENM